jgi:uncharacterized protein (TIGR02611 family)
MSDMQKFTTWCKRTWNKIPLEKLRRWWKNVPKAVRMPLVLIVGSTVIATGLAMLVLPGPGWAAIFLGFAILATEFAVAEKVRDWLVSQFRQAIVITKRWWKDRKTKPQA